MLSVSSIAPSAVIAAMSVKYTQRYLPQIQIGWCLQILGISLMMIIKANTPVAQSLVFIIIYGIGAG